MDQFFAGRLTTEELVDLAVPRRHPQRDISEVRTELRSMADRCREMGGSDGVDCANAINALIEMGEAADKEYADILKRRGVTPNNRRH